MASYFLRNLQVSQTQPLATNSPDRRYPVRAGPIPVQSATTADVGEPAPNESRNPVVASDDTAPLCGRAVDGRQAPGLRREAAESANF